ncbi:unnamed protein product [Rotaria sordida]|uniref:Uncharacterized protein n=1 Tax=Rotaria sordida TaxID=392033 RepID=A0A815GWS0_9BILA|nr:unnamed protein product [Rotaria sordida]CAF3949305.1 unnamed protein product [Rotaria sordida]
MIMDLDQTTKITLSCDTSKEHSGPTMIHSTGVPNYHIHPMQVYILQDAFPDDKIRNDSQGILCSIPPANVIEALKKGAGFSIISTKTSGGRKVWVLSLEGSGSDDGGDEGGD